MTEKQKKICIRYSKRDEKGLVHCHECPLVVGSPENYDFRCKANSHYDRHRKEWVENEKDY